MQNSRQVAGVFDKRASLRMQVADDVIVLYQAAAEQGQERTNIPASVGYDRDVHYVYTKLGGYIGDLAPSFITRHGHEEIGACSICHYRPEQFRCQIGVVNVKMERHTFIRLLCRRRVLGSYNFEKPRPFRLSIAKIMRQWID